MKSNPNRRARSRPRRFLSAARGVVGALWPSERSILTREGIYYVGVSLALLIAGLYQQVNLILLVFTLTAGPLLASAFGGRSMLRRLTVARRLPPYVFSGDPLLIDYTVENSRRAYSSLAIFLEDSLAPVDRVVSGTVGAAPRVFFPRIVARGRARGRWECTGPKRGRYRFQDIDLGTRSPFGIVEHRVTLPLPHELLVYPRVGRLTRRWYHLQRQGTENRGGARHDRSAQQVEYHGLRDYRPGDSPRWIHWRTTARRGELMVKEFEQQNEQDLALLIDPWLPRVKSTAEQREAVEQAVSFVATVCLETCRTSSRRLVLGWTGPGAGARQGPASVKMLHELLEQLAVLRPSSEGGLAELFDVMPPAMLRDALLVIVSTRPINLVEETEKSSRLSGGSARGLMGRVSLLNAANGDLAGLFQLDAVSVDLARQRASTESADRPPGETRRRGLSADDLLAPPPETLDNGAARP